MSRQIFLGGRGTVKQIAIGDDAKITVQSMWKESLLGLDEKDLHKIAFSLSELELLGLEIMRFAVPDIESAEALKKLSKLTSMPLVADVHFDYKLALECMDSNIAAVRINPGNIGGAEKVKAVLKRAEDTGTALRVGVNSGSIPHEFSDLATDEALLKTVEREMELFDKANFTNYAVSLKATSIEDTVKANELFAKKHNAPIHLGLTEAGPALNGAIKTAIAFYRLISKGIGDTIRVSLSAPCEDEVIAGVEILRSLGKKKEGVSLISCPRCGRKGFDVHAFLARWEKHLYSLQKNVTIAVMGCAVNGPGEAKNADLGITGGEDFAIIFKAGKIVHNINLKNLTKTEQNKLVDKAFEYELKNL